ncbi:group 1 truncated hemoglobin [Pelomonas sp. KK5]|uniref:group I truncated hemoglobin n=1 Tax=Pelomonas sp. KK5 TaxID=1855730 RepID=UPI0018E970CD|nr:group 1 truncated hemoglobin [Pelomonas sp. KK5]
MKSLSLPLISLSLVLAACAAPGPTLYQRLGGAPVVQIVVDRTLERAAVDERTRRSFDGIKLGAVKESLAAQICSISGGGCRYEGETMAKAHKDSKIQPREFDAMVDMLRQELDRAGVDAGPKNELLKLLAPMKRDIVTSSR